MLRNRFELIPFFIHKIVTERPPGHPCVGAHEAGCTNLAPAPLARAGDRNPHCQAGGAERAGREAPTARRAHNGVRGSFFVEVRLS